MSEPQIIDGKEIAARVYEGVRTDLAALAADHVGLKPGLAVVLVGEHPASVAYVRAKDRKCQELGLHSVKIELPGDTTQQALADEIRRLNDDPAIHGILVQSPPPEHIDEQAIIELIAPEKDVDGFGYGSLGRLVVGESSPSSVDGTGFAPCTPLGIQRMLMESGIDPAGQHVVIAGRSRLVGKPLALLLQAKAAGANATVTIAHSRSRNLSELTRQADILVAAIGRAHFFGPDDVREGAVVIDVGINKVNDATGERGYRLTGDVDFEGTKPKCQAITPVPGGVGPMTIAMLMQNTVLAARRRAAAD